MSKKKVKKEKIIEKKTEGLKWIRITDLYLIPNELFTKFKEKGYKIDLLHKYNDGLFKDGLNILFVLVDKNHKIRGFVYSTINILQNTLSIIMCEIEKEFEKYELEVMKTNLEKVKKELKLSQVNWLTNRSLKSWDLSKEKNYTI